jgi:hypothetical protein
MDVVMQEGATFFDHNRPSFTAVALEYQPEADVQGPQTSVMVNPRVLEYDTLIALNQLKGQQTATVALALKNIAMSYPAADYYGHPRLTQYHWLTGTGSSGICTRSLPLWPGDSPSTWPSSSGTRP